MLGLIIIILMVALIPLGIVMLAVKATEAERNTARNTARNTTVGRCRCAFVFGLAAMLGVLFMFCRFDYRILFDYRVLFPVSFFIGIPASGIAATLAAIGRPFLVGHSRVIATFSGVVITILTLLLTPTFYLFVFTNNLESALLKSFKYISGVLTMPSNFSFLIIGGLAGFFLNNIARKKRSKMQLNSVAYIVAATERSIE